MTEKMTYVEFLKRASSGAIFSVLFVKRTPPHELRNMNCRLGVNYDVKGFGLNYDPESLDLLNVYDVKKHGHRNIDLRGLQTLKIGGKTWMWDYHNAVFIERIVP